MAEKHGKRIGSWTSNECNSPLKGIFVREPRLPELIPFRK